MTTLRELEIFVGIENPELCSALLLKTWYLLLFSEIQLEFRENVISNNDSREAELSHLGHFADFVEEAIIENIHGDIWKYRKAKKA